MEESLIGNRSIETDKVLRSALRKDLYHTLTSLKNDSIKLTKFLDKAVTYYWDQGSNDSIEQRNRILDFLIYFEQLVQETDHIIDDLITHFDELSFLEGEENE